MPPTKVVSFIALAQLTSVDQTAELCFLLKLPPQWINCDVRKFDFSVLGKFTVIMADPPWDIHMTVSKHILCFLFFTFC